MKIDLTCPVELWHYALPTADYPVCRLQLFNLTEQTVVSVQAVFSCFDGEGLLLSRQVERVSRLDGQPRSAFEMQVAIDSGAQAAGMDFSVEKVWFSDGTVWRHSSDSVAEYIPNKLPAGQRLEVLRYLAGADALGFPSDQGAVWMCVCGRPNAAGEDTCRRCGRLKRDVFTSFNEATVETVIFEHENALEERARQERALAKRLAEEAEAAALKKKRRRRRMLGIVFGILAALIIGVGTYFYAIPSYRFYAANRQLDNGVYTAARQEFEALAAQQGKYSLPIQVEAIGLDIDPFDLPLYYRSEDLAKECTYRQATDTLNTGTIPALRTAQDIFDGLAGYSDSAVMAGEARYRRAELLLSARQYESAIALYDEIPGYRDASSLRQQALYQWAAQLMDGGEYAQAREKFLQLGNYEDAVRRAQLCLYQPALAVLTAGDYQEAIGLFTQLDPGFESTAVRLQEAYYGLANVYFGEKNYDTAAEYYLLAGDYRDAYSQATACLYEPACDLFDAGEYAQAKEMFDKIPAFRDSLTKSWQCSEALGRQALEAGDYELARTYLAAAQEYEPAQELMRQSYYIPAVALQEAGSGERALELFENIPGYEDADERVRQIRYAEAVKLADSGDLAGAIEAFAALTDYEDSAVRLTSARYDYALQLLSFGEYEQAVALLEALDGYETSAEDLQRAQYEWGMQLMEAGKTQQAAALFKEAGDYQDAHDKYQACMYALAAVAIEANQYEEAAAYLTDIPDYADSAALRSQSIYHSAEVHQEAGQLAEAAELFASIAGYQDAAERANACYDAYYAGAYNTARDAMATGDYVTAIEALESVSRQNASEAYADMERMYQEANYLYANQLYDDKKPYEALPYYRNIPDYKDVPRKLDRVCYRMLGSWISVTGIHMEFKEDGTCTLDGRSYYFFASQYAFFTGDKPDQLRTEWTIHSCTEEVLSIQNNKTNVQYKLTRVTE